MQAALSPARRTALIGTLLALGAAASYGANIPAARVASQAGLPGADLIAWRAVLFVPFFILLAHFKGTRLSLTWAEARTTLPLSLASAFTATFYLSAIDHLPVPIAVILFYTFPLVVMGLGAGIARRWPVPRQIGVFVLAFTGLVIAIGPSLAGLSGKGMVLACLAAFTCAIMFMLAGRAPDTPLRTMVWTQVLVGPVAFGFALLNGGITSPAVFTMAPIAILLAMGGYVIGYFMQLMAAQRIPASRASLLFLFEPVVAILVAGFFLGERLSLLQLGGIALILIALAVEILLSSRREAEDAG
jgi:drug/metabolite transporter (DMT)-like permease